MKTKEELFEEVKNNINEAVLALGHMCIIRDVDEDEQELQKKLDCVSDSIEKYEKCFGCIDEYNT